MYVSLSFPLLFLSPSLQLPRRVVQWRDGPTQQLGQTHSQALLAVRGLREPVSAAHDAPGASCPTAAPREGSQPARPHDQPAAVSPEDSDKVSVEASLCLAFPRTRGRIQA